MGARPVDDKPSDTLVVVSGDGFWTGSSTLPHLHQTSLDRSGGGRYLLAGLDGLFRAGLDRVRCVG